MSTIHKYIAFAAIAAFPVMFLSSCSEEPVEELPSCRMLSYDNGYSEYTYTYDANNRLSGSTYIDNGDLATTSVFERDNTGKILIIRRTPAGNVENFQRVFFYTAGRISAIKEVSSEDPDDIVDDTTLTYTFSYTGDKVTGVQTDDGNQINTIAFEWTGNNITKFTYGGGGTVVMTYDDKLNPQYTGGFDFIGSPYQLNYSYLCRNNMTSATYLTDQGEEDGSSSFAYTYTAEGFPETISYDGNPPYTYTYDCQ